MENRFRYTPQSTPPGSTAWTYQARALLASTVYVVAFDIDHDSPKFRQWVGIELTEHNYMMLYMPSVFGYGYQTLKDDSEIFYQKSSPYAPASGRGVGWIDQTFAVEWPNEVARVIVQKDQEPPGFTL